MRRRLGLVLVIGVLTTGLWLRGGGAAAQEAADDIPGALREAFASARTIRLTQTLTFPEGTPTLDVGLAEVRELLEVVGYVVVEGEGAADAQVHLVVTGKARGANYFGAGYWYTGADVDVLVRLHCGGLQVERESSGGISPPGRSYLRRSSAPRDAPFRDALKWATPAADLLAGILVDVARADVLEKWALDGKFSCLRWYALSELAAKEPPETLIEGLLTRLREGQPWAATTLGTIGDPRAIVPLKAGLTSEDGALQYACACALLALGWQPKADMGAPDVAAIAGMVWVPPGEFMMGSPEGQGGANEHPQHRVHITKGFWVGKHEVTNAQYRAFCEATGREFPSSSDQGDDHPVVWVTWREAKAYCDHYGLSLPTEAQWAYAARGPEGRVYPGGDEWDPERLCWSENSGPGGVRFSRRAGALRGQAGAVLWTWRGTCGNGVRTGMTVTTTSGRRTPIRPVHAAATAGWFAAAPGVAPIPGSSAAPAATTSPTASAASIRGFVAPEDSSYCLPCTRFVLCCC